MGHKYKLYFTKNPLEGLVYKLMHNYGLLHPILSICMLNLTSCSSSLTHSQCWLFGQTVDQGQQISDDWLKWDS